MILCSNKNYHVQRIKKQFCTTFKKLIVRALKEFDALKWPRIERKKIGPRIEHYVSNEASDR